MDHDEISEHISAAASGSDSLVRRIAAVCWPSGPADRAQPAALAWVRLWRPDKLGTPLSACSCASGRCELCN